MFNIDFNDKTNHDLGIMVTTRPSIPSPVERGEYIDIAGRDGSLLITDGTYENITIEVAMNFVRPPHQWMKTFREAKAWIKGGGKLRMSDDIEVFYKVKACGISSNDRTAKEGGHIVASFVCDPFSYFESGLIPIEGGGQINNPFMESHPIYKITGNGTCTLTVNGNDMVVTVGQNVTIDTDLMLSYREDGELVNSSVQGDYKDLWMPSGMNSVSITNGFNLSVIPNWRTL